MVLDVEGGITTTTLFDLRAGAWAAWSDGGRGCETVAGALELGPRESRERDLVVGMKGGEGQGEHGVSTRIQLDMHSKCRETRFRTVCIFAVLRIRRRSSTVPDLLRNRPRVRVSFAS